MSTVGTGMGKGIEIYTDEHLRQIDKDGMLIKKDMVRFIQLGAEYTVTANGEKVGGTGRFFRVGIQFPWRRHCKTEVLICSFGRPVIPPSPDEMDGCLRNSKYMWDMGAFIDLQQLLGKAHQSDWVEKSRVYVRNPWLYRRGEEFFKQHSIQAKRRANDLMGQVARTERKLAYALASIQDEFNQRVKERQGLAQINNDLRRKMLDILIHLETVNQPQVSTAAVLDLLHSAVPEMVQAYRDRKRNDARNV